MILVCPAEDSHTHLQGTPCHPPQAPCSACPLWGREEVESSPGWRMLEWGVLLRNVWQGRAAAILGKAPREGHHAPVAVLTHTSRARGLWTVGASQKSHHILWNCKGKRSQLNPTRGSAVRHHSVARALSQHHPAEVEREGGRIACSPARRVRKAGKVRLREGKWLRGSKRQTNGKHK